MELSRPKVLWSAPALCITTEIPLDANGTVFLLEADRHAPFAANARTGRRLWERAIEPGSFDAGI
jgi:hypothetical protein